MNKSISPSSTSKGNLRLREILKSKPELVDEVSDAQIFSEIAHQLYTLRKQSGITQKELAEKIDLKQSNISRWEKAGYQGYKIKVLSKLARTLGGKLEVSLIPKQNTYNIEFNHQSVTIYPNDVIVATSTSVTMPVKVYIEEFKKGE